MAPLPDLPGVITTRQAVDPVSDDDDVDNFAFIDQLDCKKKRGRRNYPSRLSKSKKAASESKIASESPVTEYAGPPDSNESSVVENIDEYAGPSDSNESSVIEIMDSPTQSSPLLDAAGAEIIAKRAHQANVLKEMRRKALRMSDASFEAGEHESTPPPASQKIGKGRLWIELIHEPQSIDLDDDSYEPAVALVSVDIDQPLLAQLMDKAQDEFGMDPNRTRMRMENGHLLSTQCSARERRLDSNSCIITWEEKLVEQEKIKLRVVSLKEQPVEICISPDAPLSDLLDQFCSYANLGGSATKHFRLVFDGQTIDLKKSASFYEMEDDDLIDYIQS